MRDIGSFPAGGQGGLPEQFEDGRDGLLTAPGDSAAMAHAITRLLQDPLLRRRIGEAGARTAATRYTVARESDAYLDWFAQVLEPASPAKVPPR